MCGSRLPGYRISVVFSHQAPTSGRLWRVQKTRFHVTEFPCDVVIKVRVRHGLNFCDERDEVVQAPNRFCNRTVVIEFGVKFPESSEKNGFFDGR
jgi:hypothetical protein